jgi:hypothetical protein
MARREAVDTKGVPADTAGAAEDCRDGTFGRCIEVEERKIAPPIPGARMPPVWDEHRLLALSRCDEGEVNPDALGGRTLGRDVCAGEDVVFVDEDTSAHCLWVVLVAKDPDKPSRPLWRAFGDRPEPL